MKKWKRPDLVILDDRNTVARLLKRRALYDMKGVSEIVDRCPRWLRRLCHDKKIEHLKLLGRYYMTPGQVAALIKPVKAKV